jgi:adenylate cyclase
MSAWCAALVGADDRADEELHRAQVCAAEAAATGNGYPQSYASWAASLVAIVGRDVATARRRCEDGIANAMASGNGMMFVPFLSAQLGWAEAVAGDLESGLAQLQAGTTAIQAAEADAWQHVFHALFADAHLSNGQIAEALAHADEGLGHVTAGRSCWFAAELHRLRGEALAAAGRLDAAATAINRAIDVARAQGARALEQRAAVSLARCATLATASEQR